MFSFFIEDTLDILGKPFTAPGTSKEDLEIAYYKSQGVRSLEEQLQQYLDDILLDSRNN